MPPAPGAEPGGPPHRPSRSRVNTGLPSARVMVAGSAHAAPARIWWPSNAASDANTPTAPGALVHPARPYRAGGAACGDAPRDAQQGRARCFHPARTGPAAAMLCAIAQDGSPRQKGGKNAPRPSLPGRPIYPGKRQAGFDAIRTSMAYHRPGGGLAAALAPDQERDAAASPVPTRRRGHGFARRRASPCRAQAATPISQSRPRFRAPGRALPGWDGGSPACSSQPGIRAEELVVELAVDHPGGQVGGVAPDALHAAGGDARCGRVRVRGGGGQRVVVGVR